MKHYRLSLASALPILGILMFAACGGGGNGEPEWYYHFVCNGDPDCLATNFASAPIGTSDQGPGNAGYTGCQSLIQFGNRFWGTAAQQWCDNLASIGPGGGGAAPAISGFTPMSGAPGTSVTVTGSNFPTHIADITVTVSGVTAPVTSASSTQLVITVPSMGNATGPISVVTPSGNATSSASFTVIVPNPLGTSAIRKIAPGYTHTCALLADDTVKCWGSNDFGQLGDGTTSPSSSAVSVAGVTNPVDIAVGTSFSCAIFGATSGASSGSVKCWGLGTSGQLGDNTNASSATPVSVSSVSTASQISARAHHVCALLTSGQVVCWGEGTSGQLGNNSTSNSPIPVAVVGTGPDNYAVVNAQGQPASTKAFQVTAGDAHTCARVSTSNGSAGLGVKCWGSTNHGELGDGSALCQVNTICDPKNPNPVPQYVSGLTSASQIAAGARHTCVALTSGGARCWGQGDMGQLGNGSNVHSSTPVLVSGISGATAASAGSEFSCVSSTGALKCWGRNNNGQLGNGATSNSSTPVTTTAVAAGNYDPMTLMGGNQETCMKLADNTAFCFP